MTDDDNQNWDMLLIDVHIAAMSDPAGYGAIENGALGLRAGRVAWVGPMAALPDAPDRLSGDVIDCGQVWITPGLIDCRTQHPLLREGVTTTGMASERAALHPELEDEERIKAMRAEGRVAVLLPADYYMARAVPKAMVEKLRQYDVPMALSTGGEADSLLLAMQMGRHLLGLTPQEVLHGVTTHAAKALGIGGDIGSLEVGKGADIALWDIAHPDELTAQLGGNPCLGVIKNGVLRRVKDYT